MRECDEEPDAINDEEDARTIGDKRRDRRARAARKATSPGPDADAMDFSEPSPERFESDDEEIQANVSTAVGDDVYLEDEEGEEVLGGAALSPRIFVSFNQFMRFRTALRRKHGYHHIFSTGKLGQLWLMDAYMRNMEVRLEHIRKNFTDIRRDKKFVLNVSKQCLGRLSWKP